MMSQRPQGGKGKGKGKRALWSWALYDWATQSFSTIILTFVYGAYFTRQVALNPEKGATQWAMTVGLTGLCVALCGPFLGAIADNEGRRKPWLATGTVVGALASAGLWFVYPRPDDVVLALSLLAVASFSIHTAAIFYNAMLGDLADRETYGRWSGRGWAMGYVGGLFCLASVYILFLRENAWIALDHESAQPIRAAFPFASIWLILFSIPIFAVAPDRKPSGYTRGEAARAGLRQLRESLRNVRRYRFVVRFLIARALYSDGLATIFAIGGVYAAGTFDMQEANVLLFGVALSLSAGLGAAAFSAIDDRIGSRQTILMALTALLVFSSLILWVQDVFWFWVCGILMGFFVGPAQASSRAYLSQLVPEPLRAQMFGVYALAGRSTSFLGPIIVGALTALFQSQRIGLGIVPLYFAVGLWILRGVPRDAHQRLRGEDPHAFD